MCGFSIPDQRRGHDQIHAVREFQMDAEIGDIAIGIGDDRGFHTGLVEPRGGVHDIGENAIAAVWRVLHRRRFVFRQVVLPGFAHQQLVVRNPGCLQPDVHVFEPDSLALGGGTVTDGDRAIDDGEIVLGDQVAFAQIAEIGLDPEAAERRCRRSQRFGCSSIKVS